MWRPLPLATSGAGTDALLANDVSSASTVGTPAIGQVHALLANDVASASSVSAPAVGQVHALLADDVGSASTVSQPALAEVAAGTDVLLANDVASVSSVSVPSLGLVVVGGTDRGGDGFPAERQRRKFRKATRDQLEKLLFSKAEEPPPPPTHRRVRAVQREIVEQVAGGLLARQKQEIARIVKREIVQAYQPSMDWGALIAAYEHVMRKAAEEAERIEAERIQQEIDEEDEFLLMVA